MKGLLLCLVLAFAGDVCDRKLEWAELNEEILQKFPGSKFVTVDELRRDLKEKIPLMLLDVRAKAEFEVSHLKGAVHVEKPQDISRRYKDYKGKIILYCSVGYRSGEMADRLVKAGMKRVYNLKGSIFEWVNRGFPVFNSQGQTPYVHPYDRCWGRLLNKRHHRR